MNWPFLALFVWIAIIGLLARPHMFPAYPLRWMAFWWIAAMVIAQLGLLARMRVFGM